MRDAELFGHPFATPGAGRASGLIGADELDAAFREDSAAAGEALASDQPEFEERETSAPNASALRQNIAQLAEQEWERWGRGTKKETDREMLDVLAEYYRTATGEWPDDRLHDPAWHAKYPWSAVFISWIMRKAGAGGRFKYSRAHWEYVAAAKQNRQRGDAANPFWAYRIHELAPALGDLVCKARSNSGLNYDNVDVPLNGSWQGRPVRTNNKYSHSDVVTRIESGWLTAIGGNVKHSVSDSRFKLDGRGFIDTTYRHDDNDQSAFFAVLRVGARADMPLGAPSDARDGGAQPPVVEQPGLAARLQEALRGGLWSAAVGLAILLGRRDVNALTDMIFFARHPEMKGRRIAPHEKHLAAEWVAIRDKLVVPVLQRSDRAGSVLPR